MTQEKETEYGPECVAGDRKDLLDEFDSSAWLQLKLKEPYNNHGDTLIWICPNHLNRKSTGEFAFLGGQVDWTGINYKVLVNTGNGKVVFQKLDDKSGDFYEAIPAEAENGMTYFELEKFDKK